MRTSHRTIFSRRNFLGVAAGSTLLVACTRHTAAAPRDAAVPTPHGPDADPPPSSCDDPTADNIEGPFYKRGAPHRAVLATERDAGEPFVVTGVVRSTECAPIEGALLDIWQANAHGEYDNDGYRFRGTIVTDAHGRWELHTVIPGRYLNGARYRPAHIHFKLRASSYRPLTTQLYFAGDPYNEGDPFIAKSLIMPLRKTRTATTAEFDFVLASL